MATICKPLPLAGVVALLVAGCSPPPASVRGKVTLNGRPLGPVMVELVAAEGKPYQYPAFTEADGTYTLPLADPAAGVSLGRYKVRVTNESIFAIPPPPGEEEIAGANTGGKNTLPRRYATPATTPFEVTIVPGVNVVDLDLTSP
jgi:hypothetical protein